MTRDFQYLPLRHVAAVKNSNVDKLSLPGESPVRLCNYVDVYRNDRITQEVAFMRASATPSEIAAFKLRLGDVLITKDSEQWNDIGVPALVATEADDLVCGYHLTMLRPHPSKIMGSYLAYALRVPEVALQLHLAAKGVTRYGLSQQGIKSAQVPVPLLEEQGLIVRYLDHAELRIAKAIAAKTELARLLQQQRLALLCSEVLGRDEDTDTSRDFGRLVESRVLDWVGPVPKSWDVVPMSGVFDVVKHKNIGLIEKTVLSLSYGRVVIKPAEKLRGLVPESFETYQIIEPGDVIVRPTDLQNDTTSLRIGQARDRGIITSAYIALRPKKHVDPDYVMMQLAAYDFLKVLYGFGSGLRQNLDFKHLKHVPMMLPSLAEQSAIVSRVRAKTESVEKAHAAILQEIALLREYRTRLISDVVTGKLDVCEEASKLSEIDPMELATVAVGENIEDEEATDDN